MTSIPIQPQYTTLNNYDVIQTFYADPEVVNNSSEISLTSINLYFKSKPSQTKNASGMTSPGVILAICEVSNDEPQLNRVILTSMVRREYNQIFAFADASSPTSFGFETPIKLTTGRFYGIMVLFDDPGYQLWTNKQGDRLVGTNTASPGSNIVKDGKLYLRNNSGVFRPISDTDIKFQTYVARYVANTVSENFINKNYEFLKIRNRTGFFLPGEEVYKEVANATGNVAITQGNNVIIGTGTNFSTLGTGAKIIVYGNTTVREVLTVKDVVNNTQIVVDELLPFSNNQTKFKVAPVGRIYYRDHVSNRLILADSNANSSLKFVANDTIVGIETGTSATIHALETYSIDRVKLRGDLRTPTSGRVTTRLAAAAWNGSIYTYNQAFAIDVDINEKMTTNINKYDAFILSRSMEVDNPSLFTLIDNDNGVEVISRKSLRVLTQLSVVNAGSNGIFSAPLIEANKIDMYSTRNIISNNYLVPSTRGGMVDSEVGQNGIADARHITTKVSFANNRFAEDVRVYMSAYRPQGTQLRVYARVHNSKDPEAFDDKSWTPLVYVQNSGKYSSTEDEKDFIEYEFGLPQYSDTANTLPGSFTTESGNAVIAAIGSAPYTNTSSYYVAAGDAIKIYNPVIPENHFVAVVESANATHITLSEPITNNNVVGSGFVVDRLKYPNIAFNNITNDNVSRYYNSSLMQFDQFDSMQIKIVMLADSTYKVPKIDQIQVIGVSA